MGKHYKKILKMRSVNDSFDSTQTVERWNKFKTENKKYWIILNVAILLASAALLTGNYKLVTRERGEDIEDCDSLLLPCFYVLIGVYGLNVLISFVNLIGCENVICRPIVTCSIILIEIATLMMIQVEYFRSQS